MPRPARKAEIRRAELIAATTELIISQGYRAITLEAVVRRAGCSKSAIYQLFGSKEGLLAALIEDVVSELARELRTLDHHDQPIERALHRYASRAMELILSEQHVAAVHVIISETWQIPNLGHSYYRLGPQAAQHLLADHLRAQMARGRLRTSDPYRAAVHFYGLLLWDHLNPRIVAAKSALSAAEIDAEAALAVASFLRLYAPEPGG